MRLFRSLLLAAAALLVALPLAAYTVVLKDGSRILARQPYTLEEGVAIITLQNGTRTSIDAAEIDAEATRAANAGGRGRSLELDNEITELPTAEGLRRETLSEVLARRERTAAGRSVPRPQSPDEAPTPEVGATDYRLLPRRPFRNLELAGEVQRLFRGQGVEEVLIYQGTSPGRILLDVTANSEASVFRVLEVAADTLVYLATARPGELAAFELTLATADRDPGGQFLITPEVAAPLAADELETSAFFVAHVRF